MLDSLTMSRRSPKTELIALHRAIVRRLDREIRGSIVRDAELRDFERRYRTSLRRFRAHVPLARIFDAAAGSDLVFVGDYHTLRASQLFALDLVRALWTRGLRPTIAIEAVPVTRQGALDAYLAGRSREEEFLAAADPERTWGFPWEGYRALLEFARRHRLRGLALNGEPPLARDRLRFREALAAMAIADGAARGLPKPIIVLAGDLHIVPAHLPAVVDAAFAARGIRAARTIVHQNADSLYWRLAERAIEGGTIALEIRPHEFCAFTATPLVKLQSYVNWVLDRDEIGDAEDAADAIDRIVRALARFLAVDPKRLTDYRVYTPHDAELLRELRRSRRYAPEEIREIQRMIISGESAYIAKGNIIYLGNLAIEHAAEEAAHYVHAKLSGGEGPPRARRDFFYWRAMREALAFLGSKVINHVRACYDEEDFRGLRRARGRDRDARTLRAIAGLVLEHSGIEKRMMRSSRGPFRIERMCRQPREILDGVTHCLGYLLGDRLYRALVADAIARREIRGLFHRSFAGPGEAEAAYFELIARTRACHSRIAQLPPSRYADRARDR